MEWHREERNEAVIVGDQIELRAVVRAVVVPFLQEIRN